MNPYVTEYLGYLSVERGYSRHTIAAYGRDLRDYVAFLSGRGIADLTCVTRDDVTAFIGALWDRGLAPSTVERRVAAVKGLHKFLVREGITDNHPTARLPLPKVPERLPEVISIEEVDRFLGQPFPDSPAGLRDRAMLETLYGCGLRVSELTGLELAGVDLSSGYVRVLGKGSKERNRADRGHGRTRTRRLPQARPAVSATQELRCAAWIRRRSSSTRGEDDSLGRGCSGS